MLQGIMLPSGRVIVADIPASDKQEPDGLCQDYRNTKSEG
jgi:hypothetical protein